MNDKNVAEIFRLKRLRDNYAISVNNIMLKLYAAYTNSDMYAL